MEEPEAAELGARHEAAAFKKFDPDVKVLQGQTEETGSRTCPGM